MPSGEYENLVFKKCVETFERDRENLRQMTKETLKNYEQKVQGKIKTFDYEKDLRNLQKI